MRFLFSIVMAALSIALTEPSFAQNSVPQVPNDDIFGFTTPTDIGQAGDINFANENDGRLGKRDGRYNALDSKLEFSRTLSGDWWIAGSLFSAYNHVQNVPGLMNVDHFAFDGLSLEIEHRILSRSVNNPFAASISVQPRWGRIRLRKRAARKFGRSGFQAIRRCGSAAGQIVLGGQFNLDAGKRSESGQPQSLDGVVDHARLHGAYVSNFQTMVRRR